MSRQLLVALFALALLAGCETSGGSPDEYGADTFGAGDDTIHGSLCGEIPADDPRCPLPDIASGDDATSPADSTSAGDSSSAYNDGDDCEASSCWLTLEGAWPQWYCWDWETGGRDFGPVDYDKVISLCGAK